MESKLEVFKNEEFGEIRTIEEKGKILFCGSDIAKALGLPDDSLCKMVKQPQELKTKRKIEEYKKRVRNI